MTYGKPCPRCEQPVPEGNSFCGACGKSISGEARWGRAYDIATEHWPKIAGATVVLATALEFAAGQLTPGWNLEFYLFAWASVTGALWFVFDRAERVAAAEVRATLATTVTQSEFGKVLDSLPGQFISLFDQVFGKKHLSWKCFWRSTVASTIAVAVLVPLMGVIAGLGPLTPEDPLQLIGTAMGAALGGLIFNVVPDYLSLLETRWALKKARQGVNLTLIVVLDAVLTAMIFVAWSLMFSVVFIAIVSVAIPDTTSIDSATSATFDSGLSLLQFLLPYFLTTFITSAWLWLYLAATLASRVLLRANDGVGLLLSMTDLESQPFRSLGFTSVLIVSALFLLGLPVVLL